MTHRHTNNGELLSTFFVGTVNSDKTEGRGRNVDFSVTTDRMDAYRAVQRQSVQGGDGDVYVRTYNRCGDDDCPEILKTDIQIYEGSRYGQSQAGKGAWKDYMPDGWRKDYSPMANDPEYQTYLLLKKKFEK